MTPQPANTSAVVEVHDQLADVLDRVERGETITLLRHGRRVGSIVPEAATPSDQRRLAAAEALRKLIELGKEIRARGGGITMQEFYEFRDEGRP